MYQDIATQLPRAQNHRNWDIYDQNFHGLRFEQGSRLAAWYPQGTTPAPLKVNSVHHQALKDLGRGLVVEAHSEPDGLVEAVRLDDPRRWAMAVQWHPEFHDPADTTLLNSAPLLQGFLEAAQKAAATQKAQ